MIKHRVAVIDLGTNTFNLLVADVFGSNFEIVYTVKEGVALGMGGINEGIIAKDAYLRGMQTLQRFNELCTEFGVAEIRAFGTSALREAENAPAFIAEAKARMDLDIRVISGEQEAALIYQGVLWSYDFKEPAMIMDIGGGSTEFILADQSGMLEMISLNIGVSRIFQEAQLHDPLTPEDVLWIENWLEERSENFFEGKQCAVLLGASGSFETFYEMIHRDKFPSGIAAVEIPFPQLNEIMDWVIFSGQEERDSHPYIIPIRKKMAPIAAVKTKWVMEKLGIQQVFVSPCSLKEGVLRAKK
jgi:exopolyphosphatase/guanosine-5'-triphosphate,3'-diphosphate pyrophosphatase